MTEAVRVTDENGTVRTLAPDPLPPEARPDPPLDARFAGVDFGDATTFGELCERRRLRFSMANPEQCPETPFIWSVGLSRLAGGDAYALLATEVDPCTGVRHLREERPDESDTTKRYVARNDCQQSEPGYAGAVALHGRPALVRPLFRHVRDARESGEVTRPPGRMVRADAQGGDAE